MKKRVLSYMLIVALVFLSACSGVSSGDAKNPITITVWNYYMGEQKKAFDEMVSLFNTTVGTEQAIHVESISKASITELNNQVINSVNKEPGAEPVPDMFFAYADAAYALYQMDMLADYTRYLSPDALAAFVPAFLDE
ncbi:MAG: ABC transporter substrate-binding protein, partial [Oscillospiraceae bacterium]|nr:ABC transporter substrate-binding protein [Oscillospiraceae bacterium]